MILIDLLQAGGYRFKQATLRKMQSAYFEILKAFVKHLDMPDVGDFIISGCTVVGDNITSGMMYIDGELCEFAETAGTDETLIAKNIVFTNLVFKTGGSFPVFRATNAIVVESDGVALSAFTRIQTVKDLIWANIAGIPANIVYDSDYVHTDNNFTNLLKAKLDGLAPPDFAITNPATPGYIANKPAGNLLTYLRKGNYSFGDISGDTILTVTFADVGTTNYMVVGSLVSEGTYDADNDVIWTIKTKTATSFKLVLSETTGDAQNLSFDYCLIPF